MCAAAMERRVGSSHGRAAKIEQREKGPLAVWVTLLHILQIIPCLGVVLIHSRNPSFKNTQNGMGDNSECLLFFVAEFFKEDPAVCQFAIQRSNCDCMDSFRPSGGYF